MSDVETRVQQMLSMQKRNSRDNENIVTFKDDTYVIKNSSSDGRDVMQMILGVNTIFKKDKDE